MKDYLSNIRKYSSKIEDFNIHNYILNFRKKNPFSKIILSIIEFLILSITCCKIGFDPNTKVCLTLLILVDIPAANITAVINQI